MQFYDASNKQGICQEIDRICDSDDTSYPRVDKTSRVNNADEEVVGFIAGIDGLWQFDDTNYTDFPIGTTTLVASQNDYTFASDVLEVEQVSVLDSGGIWHLLDPIDRSQMGSDPAEFAKTDGLPRWNDKMGNSLLVYPAPAAGSVTLAGGLKVTFKRTASLFTVVSTTAADTKTPGFASPYHIILAYKASLPYCAAYKPKMVPFIVGEIQRLKEGLIKHYGRREGDRRKVLTMGDISHI